MTNSGLRRNDGLGKGRNGGVGKMVGLVRKSVVTAQARVDPTKEILAQAVMTVRRGGMAESVRWWGWFVNPSLQRKPESIRRKRCQRKP